MPEKQFIQIQHVPVWQLARALYGYACLEEVSHRDLKEMLLLCELVKTHIMDQIGIYEIAYEGDKEEVLGRDLKESLTGFSSSLVHFGYHPEEYSN